MSFRAAIFASLALLAPSVVLADASSAFEVAKSSRPALVAFLKAMPKGADLHDHLDGSTWPEFILQSAIANGLHYDFASTRFVKDAGPATVPASTLKTDDGSYQRFRNAYSMRMWQPTDGPGRDHFFNVFPGIFSSGRTEGEMLKEAVARSIDQNLAYAEMIAPVVPWEEQGALAGAVKELDLNKLDQAYARIAQRLESPAFKEMIKARIDGWEKAAGYDRSKSAHTVNYIPYVLRVGTLESFFVGMASGMAAMKADGRVVATNIVMPEDNLDAVEKFPAHMKIIDYLWARMGKPNLTLHAGEFTLNDVAPVTMESRIRDSIALGHARRIGHGVSIGHEQDAWGLLKEMAAKEILVEICLSSNEMILGVAGDDHPFELFRQFGVPMSLNTDDEGISRSPITLEFVKAVERYKLSYADVVELARNSLRYSFLPGESLYTGKGGARRAEFAGLPAADGMTPAQKKLVAANPKLAMELRFERDLAAFETYVANNGVQAR